MSASAAELPKDYKKGIVESAGDPIVFKQVPLELPKKGEVLIKVLACGVCHTDYSAKQNDMPHAFPFTPGHEAIGDVVAVAEGETKWKVGDRVGAAFLGGFDGSCKACKRELFQYCDNKVINGVTHDGGYAEYMTCRSEATVRIPPEADPAASCALLCAGLTVFNGLRRQNIPEGSLVAVQGLGGLGHVALQYYNKMGYRVAAISSSGSKKEFAEKLGAHEYVDASKGDVGEQLQALGGAACIVMTAGAPDAVTSLSRGLELQGKLLSLAALAPAELDTGPLKKQGGSFTFWTTGGPADAEDAVAFALKNDVNVMYETFPLDQANEVMDKMIAGKIRFRGVLVP